LFILRQNKPQYDLTQISQFWLTVSLRQVIGLDVLCCQTGSYYPIWFR